MKPMREELRPAGRVTSIEEQQPHDLGDAGRFGAGFEFGGETLDELQRTVALGRPDELEAPAQTGSGSHGASGTGAGSGRS